MKCWVGIDLGSTTTKAVVLDEDARVVGRGITNSRNDYDVACAVARAEAFTSVRFTLCERALEGTPLEPAARRAFLDALDRATRLVQYRAQLDALREEALVAAPAVGRFFPGVDLSAAVGELLDTLQAESAALYAPGAARKSDFFRDIAASRWHKLAQERAGAARPFGALMGVFDKAILRVEGRPLDLPFEQGAGRAIGLALDERGLSGEAAAQMRTRLLPAFAQELDVVASVGTGYGRQRLPFPKEQIRSEILCHGLGAHAMFPGTATVLDIGGQDTKAIQVDPAGLVTSFQMNDRCAAGCGRYLGYIADEMNLGLHELGPLAQQSCSPVRISSTCTVFAGAEIRDRLALGQKREDILAGLHRAVILRALSLLARSGGIKDQFTFTGGVARNVTAVAVLSEMVRKNYGELRLNVSPESIYTGALGAALFARRGAQALEAA
ncbi:MAG: benzoyl-CoA reductase subunit A [Planctomycetes bacterium]|nr:benzoyl-CoA reductase subunit A [Planctomycetota bacterium]